jgi:hypothetical protein
LLFLFERQFPISVFWFLWFMGFVFLVFDDMVRKLRYGHFG